MKNIVNINKARKILWFEKFFWFISSENYLGELLHPLYILRYASMYVNRDNSFIFQLLPVEI